MNIDKQPNIFTKISFSFLMLQIVAITWLVGGMYTGFMMSMFLISIFQFIFSRFSTSTTPISIFEKTAIFTSFSLVIMSIIQYANPSIVFVNGEILHHYVRLDYVHWLPTCVKSEFLRGDLLFELCKILTAILSLLSCIKIFEYKKLANIAITFLALNIFTMSIWAIYQKFNGYQLIYNYFYSTADIYGSFFLSNSAGLFINLGIGLCLASTFLRKNIFIKLLFFAMAIISSYSSYYSASKGALIMCIATWLCFIFIVAFLIFKRLVGQKGSIVVMSLLSISALILTLTSSQFYNIIEKNKEIIESSNSRLNLYKVAIKVIEQNPIYGTGLGSIKQILPMELYKHCEITTTSRPMTAYNAHSDILNYLIEFGFLGVCFILVSILAWFYTIIKNRNNLSAQNYMLIATTLICFTHASFDMHLKTPSIMIAFVSIATLAICKLRTENNYY